MTKSNWLVCGEDTPMDDESVWIYWNDGTVSAGKYVAHMFGHEYNYFQHEDGTSDGNVGWSGEVMKALCWMSNEKPLPPKDYEITDKGEDNA